MVFYTFLRWQVQEDRQCIWKLVILVETNFQKSGKSDILLADGNWTSLIWPQFSILKKNKDTAFSYSAIWFF